MKGLARLVASGLAATGFGCTSQVAAPPAAPPAEVAVRSETESPGKGKIILTVDGVEETLHIDTSIFDVAHPPRGSIFLYTPEDHVQVSRFEFLVNGVFQDYSPLLMSIDGADYTNYGYDDVIYTDSALRRLISHDDFPLTPGEHKTTAIIDLDGKKYLTHTFYSIAPY